MSWFYPNSFLWKLLMSSGIIDRSLLLFIGPSLDVLTWSATSGYQFYKWVRTKPKEKVILIEYSPQPITSEDPAEQKEDFVLISHSTVSSA